MLEKNSFSNYLPHAGSMLLIENIIKFDNESLKAKAIIDHLNPTPMHSGEKLGVFSLIEWGAQAVGIHLALSSQELLQNKSTGYISQVVNARIFKRWVDNGLINIDVQQLIYTTNVTQYRFCISQNNNACLQSEISLAFNL